jgi:hypothetical protein
MPAPADRSADFEAVKKRYTEHCPLARPAKKYSQLIDAICRQRLFESPRLDYGTVFRDLLREDRELAEGYARE